MSSFPGYTISFLKITIKNASEEQNCWWSSLLSGLSSDYYSLSTF